MRYRLQNALFLLTVWSPYYLSDWLLNNCLFLWLQKLIRSLFCSLQQAILEMLFSKYTGNNLCCWFKWHWKAGDSQRWISCNIGGTLVLWLCFRVKSPLLALFVYKLILRITLYVIKCWGPVNMIYKQSTIM